MHRIHYTREHQWLRREGDEVVVGITEHAARQLGDVVFVELPEAGRIIARGTRLAVIESVKASSELPAPIDGEITAVNDAVVREPERVSREPTGGGWLLRMRPAEPDRFDELLDAAAYRAMTGD